jgi:hypothetical protein
VCSSRVAADVVFKMVPVASAVGPKLRQRRLGTQRLRSLGQLVLGQLDNRRQVIPGSAVS